jgi:tetratricopeptide (TPR) repeat protein
VVKPLSSNPQAVEFYQRAVYELKSYTLERRLQAYTNLTEAVKLDPGFVEAYYELFRVYFDNTDGDKLPPHYNMLANWREVAEKLRQVAPNSVQYHTANSGIIFQEWKFEEAIKESSLAVQVDPKFWMAHGAYAWCVLYGHGDAETALNEYQIAEQLDPSDVTIQFLMADCFLMERKFDLAIKQLSKTLLLEPRVPDIHLTLGVAYEAEKQYDKALDEYEQWDLLRGQDTEITKTDYQRRRSVLHEKGPRGWWQAQLDEARKDPHADPYSMAQRCARLGNTNEVFALLDRACNEHNGSMTSLLEDDCFDPFHGDPRFQKLVKKMGFHPIAGAVR